MWGAAHRTALPYLRKAHMASVAATLGETPAPEHVRQPGQEEAEKIFILVAELINPDQVGMRAWPDQCGTAEATCMRPVLWPLLTSVLPLSRAFLLVAARIGAP